MNTNETKKAKARYGGTGRIVVDDCPFCHHTHYHNPPVGEGQRAADCYQGEYILDFSEDDQKSMNAAEIIAQFEHNVIRFVSGVVFSQGSVVGILKKACRSDSDYRLVLKALSGKTSSKELTDAQWHALYLFVLPCKPEGGKWQSQHGDLELAKMCDSLVRNAVDQPGQTQMFEDVVK